MSDRLEGVVFEIGRQLAEMRSSLETRTLTALAELEKRYLDMQRNLIAQTNALDALINERLADLHDGVDGKDGINGKDGIDGKDGRDGQDGAPGRDGSDGAPGVDGAAGRDGLDGKDGIDGKDGAPGQDGVAGRDGQDGIDGKDGAPGERGERGERGDPGGDGRPGFDGRDGRDGKDGEKGDPGIAGAIGKTGEPGRDGADGRDGTDGINGADGRDGITGEARGRYEPDATYNKLDRVSFNGSEWIAKYDDPGVLPGDGWMLGAQGKRGKPGSSIVSAAIEGYALKLTMSDGMPIRVDLTQMFERYHEERSE